MAPVQSMNTVIESLSGDKAVRTCLVRDGSEKHCEKEVVLMILDQYVWFVWASMFLLPWLILFLALPRYRKAMLWASVLTTPFGLTEPLFVPEYWDPPSLFDLAQRTGFDIESLIFTFALGGVGAVLYNGLTRKTLVPLGDHRANHRHHLLALLTPLVAFPALYFLPWNPIYPSIAAMLLGAVAALFCRPDLTRKTFYGGFLILAFYVVFLQGLELLGRSRQCPVGFLLGRRRELGFVVHEREARAHAWRSRANLLRVLHGERRGEQVTQRHPHRYQDAQESQPDVPHIRDHASLIRGWQPRRWRGDWAIGARRPHFRIG